MFKYKFKITNKFSYRKSYIFYVLPCIAISKGFCDDRIKAFFIDVCLFRFGFSITLHKIKIK